MDDSACLIYIMGRGHSGSTVLDAVLGNAHGIESVGELVSGIDRFGALCSCGASFRDCEFWSRVRSDFEQRSGTTWQEGTNPIKNQAHLANFMRTWLERQNSRAMQGLATKNEILIQSISRAAGKSCIVDSSKELTRAMFLVRWLPQTKVIHLIRNPEGVLASNLHRISTGAGFKFLRRRTFSRRMTPLLLALSALSWLVGNLLAGVVWLLAPSRVLLIRYEDLCADPRRALAKISEFTGQDLACVIDNIEKGEPMEIGHNIGGNYMRRARRFTFDPHAGSKRPLPAHYRAMARFITWPLMLLYGYRLW